MIKVEIKRILQKVAGSLKITIPIIADPTAPIPVHTAYAVPMGSVCVAFSNKPMLMINAIKKPRYQKYTILPVAVLALPRHAANAISNKPPIINRIQFMNKGLMLANIAIII